MQYLHAVDPFGFSGSVHWRLMLPIRSSHAASLQITSRYIEQLYPISPSDAKKLKKVNKIVAKKTRTELKGQEEDMAFFIKNGMERYEKIKNEVGTINPDWTF